MPGSTLLTGEGANLMGSSKQKVADFHRAVRTALEPLKNAERAAGMRAYMRNQFD
jgi:actin-like ATPase involved in cell morphogenesis